MGILQFYYRKKVLIGHLEANRIWVSEGVLGSEKDEIIYNLKSISLDNDDTDSLYYSFFKLKSERYCMLMMKCEHDTGEFSCHGLIPEDGYFPVYPAELLGSPVFNVQFSEVIDDYNLPELDNIPLSGKVTYDRVSEFVKPRMKLGFNEMINAAFEYKKNGFGVFICDDEDKLPLWIGVMQMSFPLKMAHEITFTNAAYSEISKDFMIRCATGNAPLKTDDTGKHHTFDYKRGIRGKPVLNLKFTRILEVGYSVSKRTLYMFHKFISQFEYNKLDEEIDDCYNLFMLSYLGQTGLVSSDIKGAFEFAIKYGPQDVLDDIYEMSEPSFETLVRSVDMEAARPLAEYMFKTSLHSKKLIILSRACYFYFNMLDHMIMDGKFLGVEALLNFYGEIKSFCNDRAHALIKYSTEHERISYLSTILSENCTLQTGEFYIRLALDSFIELGHLWNQMINTKGMAVLMDKCITITLESSQVVNRVLDTAVKNDEYFSKVIMLFYNRITSPDALEELIRKLCSVLDTMNEESVLNIRKHISSMGGGKLLIGDLALRMSLCENKIEFFENYRRQAFDRIPAYEKGFYSEAVKIYIKNLDKDSLFPECLKILSELFGGSVHLDDNSIGLIVRAFEEGLPLTPSSTNIREVIPEVKKIKKTKNIKTWPDITGMVSLALWLEKSENQTYNISELLEELKGIRNLAPTRYTEYAAWLMPLLLNVINTPEDHKAIIHHMAKDDMDIGFYSDYLRIISITTDENSSKGAYIFVQFCVYFFFYLEPKLKIFEEEEVLDKISNIISDILLRGTRRFLSDVDHDIKMEFSNRGLSLPVKWTQIYSEVMSQKKISIIDSISEIFKGKGRE